MEEIKVDKIIIESIGNERFCLAYIFWNCSNYWSITKKSKLVYGQILQETRE